MPRPSRALTVGVFALLVLVWGTTWAAIRVSNEGIPPFTGVAVRFAVASALLFALAPFVGVRFGVTRRERWLWVSNGLLSFCASYAVVYWTEQYIPSGMASVLFATFPLFVAILAHMVIPGEPLTPRALAGVVVGFGGVAVIYSEDFSHFGGPMAATAAAVMLISPFVSAISNVLIKRWGAGVHPFSLAAIPMAFAAGVMGAVAAAVEGWAGLSAAPRAWAALLYLAVFGSALTFTLYYWLMAHLPATRVSLIAYLVPVVAVAVGAVFMKEPVTLRTLLGSALVVVGVALAVQGGRH